MSRRGNCELRYAGSLSQSKMGKKSIFISVTGHVCHSFSEDFSVLLCCAVFPSGRDISTHQNEFPNPGIGGKGQPYFHAHKGTEDLGFDPCE